MKIVYSKKTDEDFIKHRNYLRRTGKSDGHSFQKYELDAMRKSLKKNIHNGIANKKEHKKSIFPKEFEYNADNYKMYVDKRNHYIIFYKIITPQKGRPYISIEKCIHSVELSERLEREGIEPIKDADQSLLDDLKTVFHEDEISQRNDNNEEQGKEEEVYDEAEGKKVKRIVFTGPLGGRYYKTDKGEKVYIKEAETSKRLSHILLHESRMISLMDYLKKKLQESFSNATKNNTR